MASGDLIDFARAVRSYRTGPTDMFSAKLFWQDVEGIADEFNPGLDRVESPDDAAPRVYIQARADIEALCPNPVFVRLTRQDRHGQAVSQLVAARTGRWRNIPGQERLEPKAGVEYDYQRIGGNMAFARRCDRHWDNVFAVNGLAPYALTYEQLARDCEGTLRGVFALARAVGRADRRAAHKAASRCRVDRPRGAIPEGAPPEDRCPRDRL